MFICFKSARLPFIIRNIIYGDVPEISLGTSPFAIYKFSASCSTSSMESSEYSATSSIVNLPFFNILAAVFFLASSIPLFKILRASVSINARP